VEDDPAVLTLLGQWLIEQGQPEEAIGALDRAVALDPGATAAHLALVEAYRQSGRGERAQEELSVLRRLDPAAADRLSRH
jgi:predicted Zn-dependent protease